MILETCKMNVEDVDSWSVRQKLSRPDAQDRKNMVEMLIAIEDSPLAGLAAPL